jgi:hypothetical protein
MPQHPDVPEESGWHLHGSALLVTVLYYFFSFSGLYYKPMMIAYDDARVVYKLVASLTDDTRVVIYNRHMFIVQATVLTLHQSKLDQKMTGNNRPGANVINFLCT